jgi:hypothetical protein
MVTAWPGTHAKKVAVATWPQLPWASSVWPQPLSAAPRAHLDLVVMVSPAQPAVVAVVASLAASTLGAG